MMEYKVAVAVALILGWPAAAFADSTGAGIEVGERPVMIWQGSTMTWATGMPPLPIEPPNVLEFSWEGEGPAAQDADSLIGVGLPDSLRALRVIGREGDFAIAVRETTSSATAGVIELSAGGSLNLVADRDSPAGTAGSGRAGDILLRNDAAILAAGSGIGPLPAILASVPEPSVPLMWLFGVCLLAVLCRRGRQRGLSGS